MLFDVPQTLKDNLTQRFVGDAYWFSFYWEAFSPSRASTLIQAIHSLFPPDHDVLARALIS
jgi:hypothetical protein